MKTIHLKQSTAAAIILRITNQKAVLLSVYVFVLLLGSSCSYLQHRHLFPREVVIDDNSNFRMVVNAPGTQMRFMVDGKDVCPQQTISGKALEICVFVEEGAHAFRVETTDEQMSAESNFTMGQDPQWAVIRYAPLQHEERGDIPVSTKRHLLVSFSNHFPYGIV